MQPAVTFDFHNTLIRCDAWFDLEVKTLPVEVARRLFAEGESLLPPDEQQLTAIYRELRSEIIEHGQELDSVQGVRETFRRVGIDKSPAKIEPIVAELFLALVTQSQVVDGAPETLAHLRNHGHRIGIVSSAIHHEYLEWVLDHHHIRHHLEIVVSSASSGYYKSRPEIYEIAFSSLGAELEQSVHVGDSFRFDHLTGRKAGLQTVWLNESGQSVPADQPEPTLVLDTLIGAGPRIHQLLATAANAG